MDDRRAIFDSILRRDLSTFIGKSVAVVAPGTKYLPNWHVEAIAYQLERIRTGEIKRLLITMPPRSLKSISTSVAFPAFLLGHDPTKRIVCVSYAEDLAQKHARDCRSVMQSDWYRRIFPRTQISRTKSAEADFDTARRGGRLSTSIGGSLTGRGGSLVIIDDPQKPADAMSAARRATTLDWFRNTLSSRLDDKRTDAIVVVMQRLHEDDLAAHLIETGNWTHLNLPAIAIDDETVAIGPGKSIVRRQGEPLHAEREPLEDLEDLRATMGSFHFSAQYQQSPVPEQGNLVKWDWFGSFTDTDVIGKPGRIVQSWDFAIKDGEHNDFCVCITAHVCGKQVSILDIFRQKMNYPAQRKAVIRLALTHNARVILIEAAATGSPLVADLQDLNTAGVPTPIGIIPRASKIERLSIQSHQIEAGDVRLPEKAAWLDEFRHEIVAFPNGRHDDQVDALSQLLQWTECQQQNLARISLQGPKVYTA